MGDNPANHSYKRLFMEYLGERIREAKRKRKFTLDQLFQKTIFFCARLNGGLLSTSVDFPKKIPVYSGENDRTSG